MFRPVKALLGAALALGFCAPALATGIVPLSGSQQFDNATSPPAFLNGGKLYVYVTGTTTCAPAYTDFALSVLHPCPITLNSAGRVPAIYAADGSVRLRITNGAGSIQYDEDNVAIVTAASTGSSTPIPDSTQIYGTRDLKVRFDDQPVPGYVRLNGRTIGSATSGASERANSDCQSLFLELWGYANISVVTGKGATAAADWAANKQLTLPDMRSRLLGAVDDMGGGAANRLTGVTGSTTVGATGGAETKTIAQPNLPNVNFTNSGITVGNGTLAANSITALGSGGAGAVVAGGSTEAAPSSKSITLTGSVAVTAQGSAASGGSGTALDVINPVMLFTVYIKL